MSFKRKEFARKEVNLSNVKKNIKDFISIIKIKKNKNLFGKLGLSYLQLNKAYLAKKYFSKIIKIYGDDPGTLYNLAISNKNINEFGQYDYFMRKALNYNDYFLISFLDLYETYNNQNLLSKSNNLLKEFESKIPKSLFFFLEINLFPENYKSQAEIDYRIKRIEHLLNRYCKVNFLQNDIDNFKNILNFYYPPTNFFLPYAKLDILEIQKKYFSIINKITDLFGIEKKFQKINKNEKIKICFASSRLNDTTVTKLFKNWIYKINKNKFNITILNLRSYRDEMFNDIKNYVDDFINYDQSIGDNIKIIREKNLDFLIYLDFHMSREAQILSNFRLAKKQIITWGHPSTSGCQQIDYFFSSELMETEDAIKNYTETLIKIKNLSINYDSIKNSFKMMDLRNIFKKNYLNISILQSLFKILPSEDFIFSSILTKHKNIKLHFLSSKNEEFNQIIINRIRKIIKDKNDLQRINFLPRSDRNTFLNYIKNSDFLIDSMNWSGGNTHLEAISLETPIVTLMGKYLRQNHTSAILKMIGLEKLIAKNSDEYLRIISKLIEQKEILPKYKKIIFKNKNKLFNDMQPIKFIENFFIQNR